MFRSAPQLDPISALLCSLLSFDPDGQPAFQIDPADWSVFVSRIIGGEMAALFYARYQPLFRTHHIPAEQLEELHLHYLVQAGMSELNRYWLTRILAKMSAQKIPLILLKGAQLAELVYADRAWRSMGDLDLLARLEDLSPAVEVLEGLGYLPVRDYYYEIELQTGHQLPPFNKPGAAQIELHWRLFDPGTQYEVDMEGLWRRASPVLVSDQPALVLSPEDCLLYLCVHATTHHLRLGIRSVYDIALVAAHFRDQMDWVVIARRAREWHAERAAFLLLWLAARLLQAPIPEAVVEELRPPEFSPADAELACQLALTPPGEEAFIPPHLAELVGAHGLWARLRLVFSQLFLPIAVMRRTYSVRPGSWAVLFYYPARWWDLLKRGVHPARALLRGDTQTRRRTAASHSRQQQEERLKLWVRGQ